MPLEPQRLNIPIAGGLDQAETPEYLDPPALFRCDNFYHAKRTGLTKRNGYDCDTVRVDTRGSQDGLTHPIIGEPISRFIQNEDPGVIFAARGHLWSHEPSLYADAGALANYANAVRQSQIPDLQLRRETLAAIEVTPGSITDEFMLDSSEAMLASGLVGVSYLRMTGGHFYEWHLLVIDSTTGSIVSDTVQATAGSHMLIHPTICSMARGFLACCLEYEAHSLLCAFWDVQTMAWHGFTMPGPVFDGQTERIDWYDAATLNPSSNLVLFGTISADLLLVGGVPPDIIHETGGLLLWTYDPIHNSLTNVVHPGKTHWVADTGGDTLNWPALAVCANTQTHYFGAAWSDVSLNKAYFKSYTDTGVASATVTEDAVATAVGATAIYPGYSATDSHWFFCWEFVDSNNWDDTPGLERYSVGFFAMDGDDAFVPGTRGVYFDTHMMSQPWSINAAVYMLARPGRISTIQDYFFSDSPWILMRPWHDLNTNDYVPEYIQKPLAIWGYGTTQPITITVVGSSVTTQRRYQPTRFDTQFNNVRHVAVGALTCSDPQNRFVGFSVQQFEFDPTGPDRYDSAPLPGGGSIFGCSNPWIWDGQDAFEAGFVHRPYVIKAEPVTDSSGSLSEDTGDDRHFLIVVYEQVDARGRVSRSPLSQIVQVQVTSGKTAIDVTIKPLFFTARRPNTVKINIYMCRDAINYGLVATALNPTLPVGSLDEDDIKIRILAEATAASALLYTADGSLESGYPGLASHLIRWNNRVWIANEHTVAYTHQFIEGEQVQFPDTFTEELDRYVTALTPLDDRMLLFSYDAVLYRSGEGPSPNGQGSSYSAWNFLTHEIGTINSRSVFHTMVGVFFESRRGLERMDQGGNFIHVREVEDYFDQSSGDRIIGVVSLPRDHQARLLYLDYSALALRQLVLDYTTNTWSRWQQTHGAVAWDGYFLGHYGDIAVVGDTVYMVDGQGYVFVEQRAQQYDRLLSETNGDPTSYHIDWAISSPWIKLDGIQGFQRIWRTTLAFKLAAFAPLFTVTPPGAMTVTLTSTGQPIPVNYTTRVRATVNGTIGTSGKYKISYDNGSTWGAEQTLGTATTIALTYAGGSATLHLHSGDSWSLGADIVVVYEHPYFGMSTSFNYDYETSSLDSPEFHDSRSADDLQSYRYNSGLVYLRAHHAHQQCRSVQIQLSSVDAQSWASNHDVTGVYGLEGMFCELGVEPGTGRLQLPAEVQI